MVNLFGEVPLATTTDFQINSRLSRSGESQVYQQILKDLLEAKNLLSNDYLDGNLRKYSGDPERVRPTRWTACSLLARVYLYINDFEQSEVEAGQ